MHYSCILFTSFATLALTSSSGSLRLRKEPKCGHNSTTGANNGTAATNMTFPAPSAVDQAASSGGDVAKAVSDAIAAQAADPSLAAALKTSQGEFVTAAKAQSATDKGVAIRALAVPGGETALAANATPTAAQIQASANDLVLQTADVDRVLQLIADPNSSADDVKKAGVQGLANELAQDAERAMLAAGSKDVSTATALANSVGQVGPSTVLHAFTLISAGQGDAKALAFSVATAREQVVVKANCALILSGSGSDLCATRVPINTAIFKVATGTN